MTRPAVRSPRSRSWGTRPLQQYCVRFMSITSYKLVVSAPSEAAAISKAKHQWFAGDAGAFTPFAGEDDAWDAEEVRS